jgi:hypothetical protein
MTAKQFYDWQTSGGTDDAMRLVDVLERADVAWCAIGGVAVNHWAEQPIVTQLKAWSEPQRRQSRRIKDLADIARLVEAHPHLWETLPPDLKQQLEPPPVV